MGVCQHSSRDGRYERDIRDGEVRIFGMFITHRLINRLF